MSQDLGMKVSLSDVFFGLGEATSRWSSDHLPQLSQNHFQRLICERIITPSKQSMFLSQLKKFVIINIHNLDWIQLGNDIRIGSNARSE
jgi:hypothetical protein